MQKNCANCKNSYIKDGCYLICEIDGIQNDVVENCENFEVDPELYKQALREIKEIAVSTVKPNILRTDGTAMYGIDRIIELAEVEE